MYDLVQSSSFFQTSAGRNRISVLEAVHAITGQVTTRISTTYVKSHTAVDFMIQLRQQYMDLPIVLVMDNAGYQHCQFVLEKAKSMNIKILFLPPCSPNLNIIEKLWKFTKKKNLYAKYYETPAKFHRAITDFFIELNQKYQKDLETLLTLKFQLWENLDEQNLAA
jgi:transposase